MKVLLIDDGGEKYADLIDLLRKEFPNQVVVDHAKSRLEGLAALRGSAYPLVMVDLFLPRVEDTVPEADGGLKLIESLLRSPALARPWEIFAVTRETVGDEIKTRIDSLNIPLLVGSDDPRETFEPVLERLRFLLQLERRAVLVPNSFRSDCLIVTTLESEYSAVVGLLENAITVEVPGGCLSAKAGIVSRGEDEEAAVRVVRLQAQGPVNAAVGAFSALQQFCPRLVCLAGICGGVEGETEIGDLVLATAVVDYLKGKVVGEERGGELEPESPVYPTDLESTFRSLLGENGSQLLNDCDYQVKCHRPQGRPKLVSGLVACGNQVVGNEEVLRSIRERRFRKLKGVEMEGLGVAAAIGAMPSELRPKFLLAKAVSDQANAAKGDEFHPYCAEISARFLIGMLKDGLVF